MTLPQTRHTAIYTEGARHSLPGASDAHPHPRRSPHEPEENEAQIARLLDGLIDQVEDAIDRAIAHGLEGRIREIVAKRLPGAPAPATAAPLKGLDEDRINRILGLFNAVQVLDEHARRAKPGSASAKRDAACRDTIRAEIERIKGGLA